MDKLCETINRQCCLHCEMECDGKWLETEIEMYKEDLLKKQADKIADLEAKLAESEKTEDGAFWFEMWQNKKRDYDSVYKAYIENCAEVDQLKQQLAEKEKEIRSYEHELEVYKHNDDIYANSIRSFANKNKRERNQTAIAVLEEMLDNEVYINSKLDFEDGNYVLSKIIRTKIEELRNGRN